MLVLMCLFFITYSYASQDVPLLEVVVKDESLLLQKTKEKYDTHNEEYWESEKLHFYNIEDEVESFKPNDDIMNLFLEIKNTPLSAITQLPEMQSFFQSNQLYPDLPNNLDLLFKSIDQCTFSENKYFKKQILYHFKLFFYNIALNQDSLIRVGGYKNFLKSIEKCTSDARDKEFKADTKTTLAINVVASVVLGGAGIGLSVGLPNASSVFLPIFGSPLLFSYLITAKLCWNEYSTYKNFLKTIENLKQKIKE